MLRNLDWNLGSALLKLYPADGVGIDDPICWGMSRPVAELKSGKDPRCIAEGLSAGSATIHAGPAKVPDLYRSLNVER